MFDVVDPGVTGTLLTARATPATGTHAPHATGTHRHTHTQTHDTRHTQTPTHDTREMKERDETCTA